jgi:hypothetical protein
MKPEGVECCTEGKTNIFGFEELEKYVTAYLCVCCTLLSSMLHARKFLGQVTLRAGALVRSIL